MISVRSESYPSILKQIPSAPPLLYVKGDIEILSRKAIAVVGSRKYTAYGERVAQNLCRDLANAGLAITSGLALGIDAIAHHSTLDASGLTVAVLGNGLSWEEITPHSNQNLARDILENGGALVSEYPLHTPALRQNFPARNRIMAGLTIGTLVIEAARESGSLITPAYALEFNREVFAVPGNIFSAQAEGSNALIREGAKLVQSATDILLELDLIRHQDVGSPSVKKINYQPANEIEEKILKNLGAEPLHVDRLAKMTKLTPAELSSALSILEIQSAIKNIGGQNYIKI